MKYLIFLVFCLLLSLNLSISANKVPTASIPMRTWLSDNDTIDSLNTKVKALTDSIIAKDSIISKVLNKNRTLEKNMATNQTERLCLATEKSRLEDLLKQKDQLLSDYQNKVDRADTITIQMIVTYMNMKCSERRINTLIQEFDGISNEKIKSDYREWKDILSLYTTTYNTIIESARITSDKITKETLDPLKIRYVNECKQKIQDLEYVKKYLNNELFTSSYLNEMVTMLYNALIPDNGTYDFSPLLSK